MSELQLPGRGCVAQLDREMALAISSVYRVCTGVLRPGAVIDFVEQVEITV
jgi:hypothetical protein